MGVAFLGTQEPDCPDGNWRTWLALAGRGFGKTEAGARWVRERVKAGARSIALVAETQKDLEEVMVARLVKISPPDETPTVRYKPVRITGRMAQPRWAITARNQTSCAGRNLIPLGRRLAKYRYARETWDMLQFTMRAGDDPRVFVTTTPRPIPVLRSHQRPRDGNQPGQHVRQCRQPPQVIP